MTVSRVGWLAAALVVLVIGTAGCTRDAEPVPSPPVVASTPPPSLSEPAEGSSSPSSSETSAAATPSPTPAAPSPSTPVESPVAPRPERSKKPVDLDKPAETGQGLTARLTSIRAIEAKAQLPGETSGPALALTIELLNQGRRTADLTAVVVNVLDSDGAPGTELTAPPAEPLPARVAGRERARGVYVFRVPEDKRRPVTVTVSIGDAPVLVFTGNP